MVKGKFGKTLKSLKILSKWLPTKFSFTFHVFINSYICFNKSYLGSNLVYLSKKQGKTSLKLSRKAKFSTFLQLACSNFRLKVYNFQRQSITIYLNLALVFMWHSTLLQKFNFCFGERFASINKIFILAGRLGIRLSFYEVWTLSWYLPIP